ncbi:hypothetical protein [Aliiglaciecola sp. M165]|uniref:hypothetical protein n=1 Tax=Aliiglaciecola sp. M165 TaxID=2593649 RepID=UPI00117FFAF7|nr:hypothetical protein [Aliiglaciecola sp. M165]TRY28677.1 hypothetical protein FM019_20670 [Aliiglaciecola sp. M165]
MARTPKYPITVLFEEDLRIETFNSEIELITTLEWFNNEEEEIKVIDVTGARVILRIEALELKKFEYKS